MSLLPVCKFATHAEWAGERSSRVVMYCVCSVLYCGQLHAHAAAARLGLRGAPAQHVYTLYVKCQLGDALADFPEVLAVGC